MKSILVTGATGRQGGAVIDALGSGTFGDYDVYGLTRDADSDAARALAERGVTVVEGDLTDLDATLAAFESIEGGVDAVFGVTTFFEVGPELEREQGRNLILAAEEQGVEQFVFSSVGSADADTGLAHFESKADVERRLRETAFDWTILRPVFFFENLGMNAEEIRDGTLPLPLPAGVPLAMVAARDIGRAAAVIFRDPTTFTGETITLAGEELTIEATAAALSRSLEIDVEPVSVRISDARAAMGDEMADMFAWFADTGYDVDIAHVESRLGIEMTDFDTWLDTRSTFAPAPPAN